MFFILSYFSCSLSLQHVIVRKVYCLPCTSDIINFPPIPLISNCNTFFSGDSLQYLNVTLVFGTLGLRKMLICETRL